MTQQRSAHNLREVGREKLSGYFAQILDEYLFMYLSGARGINEDFIESTSFAGFGGNSFQAPDSDHILYGAVGVAKATLTASDKMTSAVIERAKVQANMMQARKPELANMVPVTNGSNKQYVCVMSEDQAYDMRTADTNGWAKYQAAAAGAEGRNNPIFKGGLGLINDVVLHCHRNVVRFSDYGLGSNVAAARALFFCDSWCFFVVLVTQCLNRFRRQGLTCGLNRILVGFLYSSNKFALRRSLYRRWCACRLWPWFRLVTKQVLRSG